MKKPYHVRKSRIHGSGVFSARGIKKGETVAFYEGKIVSSEEGTRIEEESLKTRGVTYIFQLDDERDINGDLPGNDAKYINHSCEPNCETTDSDGKICIVAIKDIKPGEEITYDYCFEFDDDAEYKRHVCKCGTKSCSGYISY